MPPTTTTASQSFRTKARRHLRKLLGKATRHTCDARCIACETEEAASTEKRSREEARIGYADHRAETNFQLRRYLPPNVIPAKYNPNRKYAASFLDLPGEVRNLVYGYLRRGSWMDVLERRVGGMEEVHPEVRSEWQSLGYGERPLLFNVRGLQEGDRVSAWRGFYRKVTEQDARNISTLHFVFPHFSLTAKISRQPTFAINLSFQLTGDRYKFRSFVGEMLEYELKLSAKRIVDQVLAHRGFLEGKWVLHHLGAVAFKLVGQMHCFEKPQTQELWKHAWRCGECGWTKDMVETEVWV